MGTKVASVGARPTVTEPRVCFGVTWCSLYLVEHIFLRAQVEVWQDSCGPDISHRQAGLGQAHRQGCGRFPFTQAGETGRERSKTSCRERGGAQNRLEPLMVCFFFFFSTERLHSLLSTQADPHSIAFPRPPCEGLGLLQSQEQRQRLSVRARLTSGQPGMCTCGPLRGGSAFGVCVSLFPA